MSISVSGWIVLNGFDYKDNEIATIDPNQPLDFGANANWHWYHKPAYDEDCLIAIHDGHRSRYFGGEDALRLALVLINLQEH